MLGAEIEGDHRCKIVWKTGFMHMDQTEEYELNTVQIELDMMYTFTHYCNFNSKDGMNFEKKTCEFHFVSTDEDTNKTRTIASFKNYNMSPYVNKIHKYALIKFDDSDYPKTYCKVIWTITEATEEQMKKDASIDKKNCFEIQGVLFTQSEARELMVEHMLLKEKM